jgi:hypothetical protein
LYAHVVKAAEAAEVVEPPQDVQRSVAGRLGGDRVELVAVEVRQRPPASRDLEPRRAQEQCM